MKTITNQFFIFFVAIAILFASCTSTTKIISQPPDAKVYINGEYIGNTPCTYSDEKVTFSSNYVLLTKEGYYDFETVFTRDEEVDVGAVIGGCILYFPFLWTMKYKPERTYELVAIDESDIDEEPSGDSFSRLKADKLRELKKLVDEGVITQEEFEIEKKKILEGQ